MPIVKRREAIYRFTVPNKRRYNFRSPISFFMIPKANKIEKTFSLKAAHRIAYKLLRFANDLNFFVVLVNNS